MKWVTILGITVCAALIVVYEWPKLNQNQKKEKTAVVTFTAMGWLLAILLLFFPEMPGPTQIIEKIYEPLSKLLKKYD